MLYDIQAQSDNNIQYAHVRWADTWVPINNVSQQAITQYHNYIRDKQQTQHIIQQNNELNVNTNHDYRMQHSDIKCNVAKQSPKTSRSIKKTIESDIFYCGKRLQIN